MIYICCVGFAYLDVVSDELNNCAWNVGCCYCLPTPMTLASGGSPMLLLVVHQPASPSIWPAVQSLWRSVHKSRGDNVLCMWVQL